MFKTEGAAIPLFPWGNSRRFNAYSDFLRKRYGTRLQKLSVNAGFSCPNRDGSKGREGCVFCNNSAFNPSYCHPGKSVHAPLDVLKARYEEALSVPDVAGLSIGTRPDCINEETLDYLARLSKQCFVHLEMGIESCYDKSLQWMNRGHDFECARQAFKLAAERGLSTGTHLIFGLPSQSRNEDLAEAKVISTLPMRTLKLHQLQIIKGTALERTYASTPQQFHFFKLEEYVDFVIDFLEQLSPAICLERFSSEAPPRFQAGPTFGLIRADRVLQLIEKRLEERDTWQGRLFKQDT